MNTTAESHKIGLLSIKIDKYERNIIYVKPKNSTLGVVYFNKHLGAAHSKSWLKSKFFVFNAEKLTKEKSKKFAAKFG